MKPEIEALCDAIERAMHTSYADKSAQAKLLVAVEAALAAQREHQAAIAELDAAMQRMRPSE